MSAEGDAQKYPRVVDQNFNGAEPFFRGGHHSLHLFDLTHVCVDQNRAPPASAYLLGNTMGGALVVEPVDRDIGPDRGEFQRHSPADALLCARDQNHLASELHVQPLRFDAQNRTSLALQRGPSITAVTVAIVLTEPPRSDPAIP